MNDNDKLNEYVEGVFAPYEGAKSISALVFDGARMDKLTYAGLKGLGADLSNMTVE